MEKKEAWPQYSAFLSFVNEDQLWNSFIYSQTTYEKLCQLLSEPWIHSHFLCNFWKSINIWKKFHQTCPGKWWCLYVYIYCLFYFAQKNTTKTQLGLVMSFQTKLRECLFDFLGLTNFLRLEEMVDRPNLPKFGRACSNWPDTIGKNTKVRESTIVKAKTE